MFSKLIGENLLQKMELFELSILESGYLNLKACNFKFLIVLFLIALCYNILFYFNLYCSLAVAKSLYTYILLNINIEKLKIKAFQLL